jgi:hypothetical protein
LKFFFGVWFIRKNCQWQKITGNEIVSPSGRILTTFSGHLLTTFSGHLLLLLDFNDEGWNLAMARFQLISPKFELVKFSQRWSESGTVQSKSGQGDQNLVA